MGGNIFQVIIFVKTIASGGRGCCTSVFNCENVWQDTGKRRRDQQNKCCRDFYVCWLDYKVWCGVCIQEDKSTYPSRLKEQLCDCGNVRKGAFFVCSLLLDWFSVTSFKTSNVQYRISIARLTDVFISIFIHLPLMLFILEPDCVPEETRGRENWL